MPLELLTPESDDAVTPPASGLRTAILSPLETLSQSISAIAPTTSPALTVPAVFALAGNGTWLAYALACAATLLMAFCIARFARQSASPGSLYKYATNGLPALGGHAAGWALLLAYTATAASVVGGFLNYTYVLIPAAHRLPAPLLVFAFVLIATLFAYRDVQASARMMLIIEAASVSMIAFVVLALLFHHGPHLDAPQLHLEGISPSGVRLGFVLAIFSFVGFESATTLGHEARNPLRTIPRAVIQSALLAGLFFLLCCYTETLGFRQLHLDLGTSQAPFRTLSSLARLPVFGPLIDIGALISMFACTLACLTAAARVLLKMAHDGLVPALFGRSHARNQTPHLAVFAIGAIVFILSAALSARGLSGADIYAQMGSLAVYGFITVYFLVAVALPISLRRTGTLTPITLTLAVAAALAMLITMLGTLYPVPQPPYNRLPWLYLIYLATGLAASTFTTRNHDGKP